ncbi:MAG: hypothetical protein HC836_42280 [Richelia sp. RM2_1_2]|nr:hypothetical protein [Richelia sp. RM2_1_2]
MAHHNSILGLFINPRDINFGRYWLIFIVLITHIDLQASQIEKWEKAKLRPEWHIRIDKCIFRTLKNKEKYEFIQNQKKNGLPWFVIAGLHERESTQNFNKHLHEGSPLSKKTQYIPKGRLPDKPPPYTWEESAFDALYTLKKLHKHDWQDLELMLELIEKYNGLGYRKREINSPYLWSGTTIYERGKYIADGKFSYVAVDKQIGVAALLKRMEERDIISLAPDR